MVQRSKGTKPQEVTVTLLCETPCPGLIDHGNLVKPLPQVSSQPCPVSASLAPTQHQPPPPLPSPPQTSPMIFEKKTLLTSPSPMNVPKAPSLLSSPIMDSEGVVSPPKVSGFASLLKPPLLPKEKAKNTTEGTVGESSRGNGANRTRLKPLYLYKVVANVDHSTVWDQISDGSFRSLAISRKGILDALQDGQGLSAETLERLTRIAPTQEEEAKLIHFSGNLDKLADAGSFLYHILKAVPTAFIRLSPSFQMELRLRSYST
ncbi:unnamed protein product [Sphenostylis stenocarpa]|uniref:FH2 domain-containing protein n=1 Tax=Sphenostylis stenocarpa TaxID=92480 RepID=A0AA86S6H1_9FABA|nr:unnamed protein product [Sphenostylis stenocarpa]